MNENNIEAGQEMPVTVEYVPVDSEEANQTIDTTDSESLLLDEIQEETSADNLLNTENSSMDLTGEMLETLPEDTVTLQQIHYDLLIVSFLLLLFWLYERIKVGLRNFRKTTK